MLRFSAGGVDEDPKARSALKRIGWCGSEQGTNVDEDPKARSALKLISAAVTETSDLLMKTPKHEVH